MKRNNLKYEVYHSSAWYEVEERKYISWKGMKRVSLDLRKPNADKGQQKWPKKKLSKNGFEIGVKGIIKVTTRIGKRIEERIWKHI